MPCGFDKSNKKHKIALVVVAVLLVIILAVAIYFIFFNGPSLDSFDGPDEEYQRKALELHNEYRKKHHAESLALSRELNTIAKACAAHYADIGTIDHSCKHKKKTVKGTAPGENLYMSTGASSSSEDMAQAATKAWYDEVSKYTYTFSGQPSNFGDVGHFTQLVWKESKELGIGYAKKGDKQYIVGIYNPPGNYGGQYQANVVPP